MANPLTTSTKDFGFTLIEVLVTLAIFSLTVLMAVSLFVVFVQNQRRTINIQELQNDSRAVMERLADELHEGQIDYTYYESTYSTTPKLLTTAVDASDGANPLVLRDALNTQVFYRLKASVIERCTSSLVPACATADPNWTPVSPTTLTVQSFTYFVTPSENPYAGRSYKSCILDSDCPTSTNPRWGTVCVDPLTSSCYLSATVNGTTNCYCVPQPYGGVIPLAPKVTIALQVQRSANQQTVTQVIQTTIASRELKSIDLLNSYAP